MWLDKKSFVAMSDRCIKGFLFASLASVKSIFFICAMPR